MIKYIKDLGSDMHTDMEIQIFLLDEFDKKEESCKKLRYATKNGFVFPQFYGDYYGNNVGSLSREVRLPMKGAYKDDDGLELFSGIYLGEHLKRKGIRSVRSFTEHLREIENHFWTDRFPVFADWKKLWWRKYQKIGYFDMLSGFRFSRVLDINVFVLSPI